MFNIIKNVPTDDQRFNFSIKPGNGKRFFTLDAARAVVDSVARTLQVDRNDIAIRGLMRTQWYTVTGFDTPENFDFESYFESRVIDPGPFYQMTQLQVIVRQT